MIQVSVIWVDISLLNTRGTTLLIWKFSPFLTLYIQNSHHLEGRILAISVISFYCFSLCLT